MKNILRVPAAVATAGLIAGVAIFEPVSSEPHAHDAENAPVELILHTGLGASGGFTNTSAAANSTSSSLVWVLPSSSSTFLHDLAFANRLGQVGIIVRLELPAPAASPQGAPSNSTDV